jgi:CobQ-like glutamine amidotransferase family enzyme
MPRRDEITVVLLYPDLLGTYGDRGNALALAHRARTRGLSVRIVEVAPDEVSPRSADIYLIGGGEDTAQTIAGQSLRADRNITRALGDGATCLAVCAGFQLLAQTFTDSHGADVPGLGVLDVRCGRLPGPRAVGEVIAYPVGIPAIPVLTSYENHQGDAVIGPGAVPLGRLLQGVGNGDGATEGAVQGNIVATYLHGPVLVRNPALADYLLEKSTGPLPPMRDEAIERLRRERLSEARVFRHGQARLVCCSDCSDHAEGRGGSGSARREKGRRPWHQRWSTHPCDCTTRRFAPSGSTTTGT